MPSFLRNPFWRPLPRRTIAGLALVSFLAASVGFPIPVFSRKKEADQPFPCQGHGCGCQTAEQCWRHCCCFTPEEQWAWARRHKVQPPPYAEKPVRGWRTVRLRDRARNTSSQKCSCCSRAGRKKMAAPRCQACVAGRKNHSSCCQKRVPRAAPKTSTRRKERPVFLQAKTGFRWHRGLVALKCQGESTLWMTSGALLPPPGPVTWSPVLAKVGWLSDRALAPSLRSFVPPVPPPRSSCA